MMKDRNYMLEKVKEIMKYIDSLKLPEDYYAFEIAFLISARTGLRYDEVNTDIIEKIKNISDSYDSLVNESISYDIENIFNECEDMDLDY